MKKRYGSVQQMDYIIIMLLGVIFFVMYRYTLFPGVGGRINYGDSAEWQFLHLTTGTSHPSGYPLFILISKIFAAVLPFQTIAYRITAISLIFAVLTIILIYLVSRLLNGSQLVSFLSAMFMGATYTFWTQATEAEVYTLNSFFMMVTIYFFLKFYQTKKNKYLLIGSLIYAISFGNHLSMILLLPALIYLTLKTKKTVFWNMRIILSVILFTLIGISQYVYLYYLSIQPSPYNYTVIQSLQEFIDYVTGKQFQPKMFSYSLEQFLQERLLGFYDVLTNELTVIGLVFIFLGMVVSLFSRKKRTLAVFLLLIGVFHGGYALNYNIMDIEVYYIPVFLVLILFIPFSFCWQREGSRKRGVKWSRWLPNLLVLILMLTVLFSAYKNVMTTDIVVTENVPLQELAMVRHYIPEGSTILIGKQEWKTRNLLHYLNLTKELGDYHFTAKQSDCIPLDEFYFTSTFLLGVETIGNHDIELYGKVTYGGNGTGDGSLSRFYGTENRPLSQNQKIIIYRATLKSSF